MTNYRNEKNNENEKYCPKCETVKPRTQEFWNKNSSRADGLYSCCKQCLKEKNKSTERKEYLKHWRKDNPEKTKDHQEKNRESIKQWRKDNPEWKKQYYEQNKEELNRKRRNRRSTDPIYKLRCNVSTLVYIAITRRGGVKNSSVFEYLPYTVKQLREHLESQFDENMNWDNYGSYWHVDHIYPQALLPYENLEDENFQKCWALDNLRPLEKIENIKKSNKIIPFD